MKITPKQEAFAQAIASGQNQSDAYRAAYKVRPGTKAESVNQNASRIMGNVNVVSRVKELRKSLENKGLWTREKSVLALSAIVDGGEARPTEKVAAIKELNVMHGFNAPTKIELGGSMVYRVELVAMDDNSAN